MNRKDITRIAFTAIFMALVFVATFTVKFPISLGWGYIHLGDSVVLLSGMLLGPIYGAIAAGIGSFIADFAGGFAVYAVPTMIIKASAAFFVGLAYKSLKGVKRESKNYTLVVIYHSVVAYICVVGGYFLADLLLAKLVLIDTEGATMYGYAAYGVIPNSLQIGFGIFASFILYGLLRKPFEDIYRD